MRNSKKKLIFLLKKGEREVKMFYLLFPNKHYFESCLGKNNDRIGDEYAKYMESCTNKKCGKDLCCVSLKGPHRIVCAHDVQYDYISDEFIIFVFLLVLLVYFLFHIIQMAKFCKAKMR